MRKSAFGCYETSPGEKITRACKMKLKFKKNCVILPNKIKDNQLTVFTLI